MPLFPISIKPGIIKDATQYTAKGGWYDSDKIRFRLGMPESIGGWVRNLETQYLGTARAVHQWAALDGTQYTAIGTNTKLYLWSSGSLHDITPIRRTVTLGTNPFETQSISNGKLTVSDVANGAVLGDYVTFSGATAFDNYTTVLLNAEHRIIEIIDADSYTIEISGVTSASAGVSGGGASVEAEYQINVGSDSQFFGTGWGTGTWGRGTWGSSSTPVASSQLRLWSLDNFGEDLVAGIRGGGIYYWTEADGTNTRAVALSDLSGSNQAPTVCLGVAVSEIDRHILVFGANENGSSESNPLLIRFSSQESAVEWEERTDTTAGAQLISSGSEIIGWTRSRQEQLVWTDRAIHSFAFTGPPGTFALAQLAEETSLIGPNAIAEQRNTVYWMDGGTFKRYDGSVSVIDCPVQDYVVTRLNTNQAYKVFGASNYRFNEVWWFYPSTNSNEVDSYVKYNYVQDSWDVGTLVRTAWLDDSFDSYPIGLNDGYIYTHEWGVNADGETLTSYIEGADLEIGDGDDYSFIRRIIPSFTRTGTNQTGELEYCILVRNYPNESFSEGYVSMIQPTTKQAFVRVRGRQFALRVSCSQPNLGFRLGTTRFDMQPDGKKS